MDAASKEERPVEMDTKTIRHAGNNDRWASSPDETRANEIMARRIRRTKECPECGGTMRVSADGLRWICMDH